jgi:hypothetical protein
VKILTRKRYDREIRDAIDDGRRAADASARARAKAAHGYGYQDGFAAARATGLSLIEGAIEHALTNVEAEHQDTTVEHANAVTRWEKRRLQGRLEALEIVAARLTAQLEEIRES